MRDMAATEPKPDLGDRDLIAGGKELFGKECRSCHGARGRGVDLIEILQRDLAHFVLRQRLEHHDLVDAVAEFRREPAFQFPVDIRLHGIDGGLALF